MRKLKIKCTRFKKFCNYNTLSNSRDWSKVIRVKLKFGANLSFSQPLSPMPNVFLFKVFEKSHTLYDRTGILALCFPYFVDISIVPSFLQRVVSLGAK
jgi:hypothetical protein